jgi:hypothetical protein
MNLIDDFSNLDFKPGNKKKKKTRKKRSIIENNNTVRDINDLNPLLDNPPIILKFNESKKSFDFTIDYTTKQWEDENNDERKIQSELKEIDDKEKEKDIVKFPCLKQRKKSLPINILIPQQVINISSNSSLGSSLSSSLGSSMSSSYESNNSIERFNDMSNIMRALENKYSNEPVYRIKISNNKFKRHRDDFIVLEEHILKENSVLQSKLDRIRLSGNYLKQSHIYNGGVIIFCSNENIEKFKMSFKQVNGENVFCLASISIPRNRKNFNEYFMKEIYKQFGTIEIKNHLNSILKKFDSWIMHARINDCLLLLVETDEQGNLSLDIPAGKRLLGESSWNCCVREACEETGFNILDKEKDKANLMYRFHIDLMNFFVIRK